MRVRDREWEKNKRKERKARQGKGVWGKTQNTVEKALTHKHTRQNDTKILTKNNGKQEKAKQSVAKEKEVKSESSRIKKNARDYSAANKTQMKQNTIIYPTLR